MHELLLFGQVPAAKHALVVSALAGLTALQPQPLAERHLVFRPKRDPGTPSDQALSKRLEQYNIPKSFRTDTYYVQAVGNLAVRPRQRQQQQQQMSKDSQGEEQSQHSDGKTTQATSATNGSPSTDHTSSQTKQDPAHNASGDGTDMMMVDSDNKPSTTSASAAVGASGAQEAGRQQQASTLTSSIVPAGSDFAIYPWEIEFRDLLTPIAGSDKTTKRITFNIDMAPDRSPVDFLQEIGYRFVNEHMLRGHRFSHGNIDLRLFRGYGLVVPASDVPGPGPSAPIASVSFDPQIMAGGQQPPLQPSVSAGSGHSSGSDGSRPSAIFSALDPSGAYLLQARLLVDVDNDPKITKQGQEEMERLREQLRGLVDLEMAPRLAMNTRIR